MGQETGNRTASRRALKTRQRTRLAGPAQIGKRRIYIALILLLCVLFYPRAKAMFAGRDPKQNPAQGPKDDAPSTRATHDINILLLGVDERGGDTGRSDTMILVNYNAWFNSLRLMSIPRDTRVKLPKYGYQKINAAYPYGGPALAKQAVGDLAGLYIDYYIKVNFAGFAKVVDALGGVTVNVKDQMDYDDPYQDLHIHFEPGRQRLDGGKALEYVRWRGGALADLGRVERQREFLDASLRRAASPAGVLRSPLVLHALGSCLDTDIPMLERPGLALNIAIARLLGLKSSTVPGETATIGNGSYFIANTEELMEIVSSWSRAPWSRHKEAAREQPE